MVYVTFYRDEAEGLAKRLRVRLYRTSVKEDLNVTNGTGRRSF